jgi:hypothetical protein
VTVLAQLLLDDFDLDDLETLETIDGAYLSSKLLAQGV